MINIIHPHPGRRLRLAMAMPVACFALLATGCFGQEPAEKRTSDEITKSPPFMCTVVPKNGVELLYPNRDYSTSGSLRESPHVGRFQDDEFLCVVESVERFALLDYYHRRGDGALLRHQANLELMDDTRTDPIPSRMGKGWVENARGISGGWAYWACGGQEVVSEITYRTAPESDERHLKEDTTRLLEIAQQRYAELNDCEIRPPASSPSKSTSRPTSRLTPPPEGAQP